MKCAGLLLICLATAACGSVRTTSDREFTENIEGEPGYSQSTSLSFSDGDEALLEDGKRSLRAGRYAEAEEAFARVAEGASEPKHREEALYLLAETHGNLLNPRKDFAEAIRYLETLLAEFPETSRRAEVESQLESLRSRPGAPNR